MAVILNPYLSFDGKAKQAMEFYQSVFGGDLSTMTFGDMPDMPGNSDEIHHLVMHSMLVSEVALMGSDSPPSMGPAKPNGTVSISGDDEAKLRGYWDKLAEGAQIRMPLEKAPWGDSFGQLTDQFGVDWMINIAGQPEG